MSKQIVIGTRVSVKEKINTPYHVLHKGVSGLVLAVDTQNCMVQFDTIEPRLIVPKDKLEVLK